jgi:hypothetical protein
MLKVAEMWDVTVKIEVASWYLSTNAHDVIFQKVVAFLSIAVRTIPLGAVNRTRIFVAVNSHQWKAFLGHVNQARINAHTYKSKTIY